MNSSKFFRLTVEGDNLNPDRVRNEIDLPAEVFFKNVPAVRKFCGKERVFPQETNRWVYSCESIDGTHPETFLTKNLQVLQAYCSEIKRYSLIYNCFIDLVLYCGDKTDICLNPKQIKILQELGVKLYISFF